MRQNTLRHTVALTVIFGHIALFVYGFFFLGVHGPFWSSEAMEIILLSTPTLAVAGGAALVYVLDNETNKRSGKKVNRSFMLVTLTIPVIFIAAIGFLYYYASTTPADFGVQDLKLSLGILETMFAGYIGAITSKLFPAN